MQSSATPDIVTEVFTVDNGNVSCTGTMNNAGMSSTGNIDCGGNILTKAADYNNSGTKGLFFRDGYTTSNVYNCSISTYDHSGDTFSDGLSINGFDGISFCTGSNGRLEKMRIDTNGKVNINTTTGNSLLNLYNGDISILGANLTNALSTTENRMITYGGNLTSVLNGDFLVSSYWGIALNLNAGGNGDSTSASQKLFQQLHLP